MKCIALGLLTGSLLVAGTACQSGSSTEPAPAQPEAAQSQAAAPVAVEVPTTGVRSIALPTIDTAMPAAPGQPTFMSACIICHSPRYVLMQPAFPMKTWVAEVDKMKKVYGAPILDEQVEPIVNYLMAVRGRKE